MEQTILEMAKELSIRAEEIGKLREQVRQKDTIINGLIAQMSEKHDCKCGSQVPPISKPVQAAVEDIEVVHTPNIATTKPVMALYSSQEVVTEQPRQKRKYTKRSESWNKKGNTVVTVAPQKGGTVFKSFEPLELSKVVVEGANTSAYVPGGDKKSYNDTIAAIAAGLGSSSSI